MTVKQQHNAWDTMPKSSDWYVAQALQEAEVMSRGVPTGYPLGFKTFDSFFRLRTGQFMVIAGRPAMGKTSFALQVAMNLCKVLEDAGDIDGRIVFYSAEMHGVELYHKMASQISGVNLQKGYAGRWTSDESDLFKKVLDSLGDLPMVVSDLSLVKTERMEEELHDLRAAGLLPRAVFFDYIELADDQDARQENVRVAQIAQRLKHIAQTFDIPVVGLSQVNRLVESDASKMPMLANMAGSDTVARMADKVLVLMRPGYYLRNGIACACEENADAQDICYVSIQKDRFGRAGQTFRMALNEDTFCFGDVDPVRNKRPVYDLKARKPSDVGLI